MEISDETYFYDRTRPWRISSLTTTPHDGAPETHAALNRPMGALNHVKNQVELETSCLLLYRDPVNEGTTCPLTYRFTASHGRGEERQEAAPRPQQ